MAFTNILQIFSACIMIGVITPLFFGLAAVLFIIYTFMIGYYLKTSREVRRLVANGRSPLLSILSESMNGIYLFWL